ncbi:MAG TPA: hypothetical protein VHK02_04505 [Actinomycetota bacterium]|nr:hypothetical protein [Actinomycetota bacterium]
MSSSPTGCRHHGGGPGGRGGLLAGAGRSPHCRGAGTSPHCGGAGCGLGACCPHGRPPHGCGSGGR